MELRRLTIFAAFFVLAISHCSEAHSMHRRQAFDDENYDDPQLGDEAADEEALNDTEQAEETKPPSIETNSTNYEIKSGEDVILECKVNPENGTVVSWYRNNLQIFLGTFNLLDKERYSIVNGKNLKITNAEIEDSGVFRCKTMHETASVFVEHNLLVTEAPVIRNTTATNGGYIAENTDLLLTCNITASPVPSVVWSVSKMDQNRNLNEKDAEFHVNGTIYSAFIKNVKRENTGKYLCYAFNRIGQHQAEINVVVSGKPQVHVPRTIVNSDLQIEAVLQCTAHEEARPSIRWYKDGVLIEENSAQYVISTQGSHSNLTVTPTADGDFGTFTCEAANSYGTHNRSIELVQIPVIEDLDVDETKMAWTVHSHQPLEEIELQLQSTNDGEWTTFSVPVPEGRHHKYDFSYIIDNSQLQPGEYLATVKVRNTKEWGSSNEPAIVKIQDPQSLSIQTASVVRGNNAAHSIRPFYTALSTVLMYLLVRML
ncbi:hypothetical protein PYW08_010459 [Mythimna loreyi]|uniref:Uncharacterized protein n=1 Tax=Mythimna loreyi TaxID=667449 RepID=A0ACC2Q4V9_9NEOP|nr:hypothetical protein PYW08_010459 [Mythimna loreyi]